MRSQFGECGMVLFMFFVLITISGWILVVLFRVIIYRRSSYACDLFRYLTSVILFRRTLYTEMESGDEVDCACRSGSIVNTVICACPRSENTNIVSNEIWAISCIHDAVQWHNWDIKMSPVYTERDKKHHLERFCFTTEKRKLYPIIHWRIENRYLIENVYIENASGHFFEKVSARQVLITCTLHNTVHGIPVRPIYSLNDGEKFFYSARLKGLYKIFGIFWKSIKRRRGQNLRAVTITFLFFFFFVPS
jgi:hypothetical protein